MTDELRVHRNLNLGREPSRHGYSVERHTPRGWRLSYHTDHLMLRDVRLVVSDAGRARALLTGRRNVHAWAIGTAAEAAALEPEPLTRITYNPFISGYFQRIDTGERITEAPSVLFRGDGAWLCATS